MVRSLTPETLVYDLVGAGDPTISPDGARILYSLGRADRAAKLAGSQLWVCDIDGGSARQLTRAGDRNGQGRWAPDGSRIAFVSDRVAKSGVFVMALDGGEPREVTRHNGPVADLAWSPDGTRLAYVALFDPENPDERDLEEWEASRVRVTRRVDYKQDNRGYLADLRGQVWIVEVETGERRMLTGGAFDHNQPQWSPDGERIAAKVPTKNGMCSHLAVVDVQSGQVTEVGPEGGVVGCWAWSPEGDRILIAGDATPTWQLDLFVHFTGTGELARLTDDLACLPDAGFPTVTPASQPVWLDETRALFHAVRAGQSGLYVVDTTTGDVEALVSWQALNGGLSVDAAGHFAVQGHTSLEEVGEILVTDLAGRSSRVITRHNAELLAEAPPARWERIDVQRGEFTIEAWLLSPAGFEGGEGGATRPLVLDVHGGPNGFYGYGFNAVQQSLAAAGNFVLYCNPRGSSSYGRHFTAQVTRDWGGEDYLDLMAAVDEAVTRPGVDAERLGVYGYSYGGFMTSWIIGHTDRFKAAAIGAPVVDLVSFYGTSDIGHMFGPLQIGGTPDEIHDEYVARSPLTHLTKAMTPALILHGEADDRCPIGQGEQLFAALLDHGCEVEFVRYPGGAHPFVRVGHPAHRLDFLTRLNEWFGRHLG